MKSKTDYGVWAGYEWFDPGYGTADGTSTSFCMSENMVFSGSGFGSGYGGNGKETIVSNGNGHYQQSYVGVSSGSGSSPYCGSWSGGDGGYG